MIWNQLTTQLTVGVLYALILGTGAEDCSRDGDCRKANMYCYDSRICVNCTDCKIYNRNPGRECAKHKDQCGDCLPGMEADVNIDGSLSLCRPTITSKPPIVSEAEDDANTIVIIIVACSIIVSLIAGVGCWFFFKRCRNCSCSASWKIIVGTFESMCPKCLMNNRDCPPPYTEKNPTAPPYEEPIPPAPNLDIEHKVSRHVENDPSQRANPCVTPNWVRGGSLSSNPTDHQEPTENDLLMDPSIIHDQDTQPSTWSPTAQSTGPTSFQNSIVNLATLNISQPGESPPRGTDTQSNSSRASSTISINIPPNNAGNNTRNENVGHQININVGVCLTNNNINL